MESAGITVVTGDLMGLERARHLAAATLRNVRQNLFFAFVCNAAAISLRSVSVIGSALRLRTVKF